VTTGGVAGLGLSCERSSDNVGKVRNAINPIIEAQPACVGHSGWAILTTAVRCARSLL
jgi:hypothetical protein